MRHDGQPDLLGNLERDIERRNARRAAGVASDPHLDADDQVAIGVDDAYALTGIDEPQIGHFDPRNMSLADPFADTSVSDEVDGAVPDLPSPDTKRWVVRRKAIVVAAVRNGSISLQEACRRYKLSVEEFLAWQRAIDRYGVPGLRVTRLQIYRDTDEARSAG